MTVTNETFVFLTQFPFITCICVEILVFVTIIQAGILVPDQFWIIVLSWDHEEIEKTIVVSSDTFTFWCMVYNFISLDKFLFFTLN